MTEAALVEPSNGVRRRRLWSITRVPRLAAADGETECFVCDVITGQRRTSHHIIHEDDDSIAFLAKWPPLWGTTLVCPKRHLEAVVDDFDIGDYLALQRIVHRVGRALTATVPCDRLYVMSLGSTTGNNHVHWHLAPLPPGVPRLFQQCRSYEELLMGRLDIPESDNERLAEALRTLLSSNA